MFTTRSCPRTLHPDPSRFRPGRAWIMEEEIKSQKLIVPCSWFEEMMPIGLLTGGHFVLGKEALLYRLADIILIVYPS